jgi:hypothetical protein
MDWKKHIQVIILSALIIIAAGCATPRIQPVDPQIFLNSELAFIKDGVTTREEVCLKLGVPTAQLEGDRILMFQFRADEEGKWQLVSPKFSGSLRGWDRGTMSLVLVFGNGGVLQKHSTVISK